MFTRVIPKSDLLSVVTREQLFAFLSLEDSRLVQFVDHNWTLHTGIVQGVQRESGCGLSFNVYLLAPCGCHKTVYVRCKS